MGCQWYHGTSTWHWGLHKNRASSSFELLDVCGKDSLVIIYLRPEHTSFCYNITSLTPSNKVCLYCGGSSICLHWGAKIRPRTVTRRLTSISAGIDGESHDMTAGTQVPRGAMWQAEAPETSHVPVARSQCGECTSANQKDRGHASLSE